MELNDERPRRQMDHSNADARRAVSDIVSQFAAWRSDLATFAVLIERDFSAAERERMLARCGAVEAELLAARTDLLAELADAPQKVAGHSRVVDVERALDNIEMGVKTLRGKLTQ